MASLVFLIAFWSLKQAKNEGELGIVHGKARLKLNYMKNPSFRRALKPLPNQSSMQGRESKKQSNIQEFHDPFAKYSQACELPKKEFRKPC